jgi:hypothetical protein
MGMLYEYSPEERAIITGIPLIEDDTDPASVEDGELERSIADSYEATL